MPIVKEKKQCAGDGKCLTPKDKKKYTRNLDYVCEYNCYAVLCPNYKICKQEIPKYILDHNFGTCGLCALSRFDKWGRDDWRDLYYVDKKKIPEKIPDKNT